MSDAPDATDDSFLSYHWAGAGIVSAAARLIPIPFIDEKVQVRCRRYVVRQTLVARQSRLAVEDLKPLYNPPESVFGRILGPLAKVPVKLLLFPVRKSARIVTSFRGVPLEVLNVFLLGRTLSRHLNTNEASLSANSKIFGKVFQKAFHQIDLRIAQAAVKDVLRKINNWQLPAQREAESLYGRPDTAREDETHSAVRQSATEVSRVLQRPEVLQVFARFDQRFDRLFADKVAHVEKAK